MSESEGETERTAVKTYLPAYQRDEWDAHAEELGMSRSEFIRSMVQAGRRGFEETAAASMDAVEDTETEPGDTAGNVPVDLESTVLQTLQADEFLSWDELLAAVTTDIEDQLEETLQDLQAADKVRYSGRNGGYTLEQ